MRPLETAHRNVGIDRHDEKVGLGPGSLEQGQVAEVEEIETSVGERHADALAFPSGPLGRELVEGAQRRRRCHSEKSSSGRAVGTSIETPFENVQRCAGR